MFRNPAAEFVYTRTYSKWIEELNRRETWPETVERFTNFIFEEKGETIPPKVKRKIKSKILNFEVMPSMRALWSAGPAAKQSNVTMYNCSFVVVDSVEAFSETLYVLCCGTGLGFSVESKYTSKLPTIKPLSHDTNGIHTIEDTKESWADSVKVLMNSLYEGKNLVFDYSKIRPAGARLKTMGGRASGPEPLVSLHRFIKEVFRAAEGRQLTTLECHDIMNKIAEIVVVGGVRRSSQVSLSDLSDPLMRDAKNWPFPIHRSMANNSAVYLKKPTAVEFLKEWASLAESGTGERGIFNLESARKHSPDRRNAELIEGTNPCAEVHLRNQQFCNLSEVIIREDDDLDSLLEKVETATWLGVIQSSFTNFPYLRAQWRLNCEEERLLGVSLTGQMDNKELLTRTALKAMKQRALKTAKHAAEKMGINFSVAVTLGKPSGTVSQLCDAASGMHTRFSEYYIRRYRISAFDSLYKLMKAQGLKLVPENGQETLPEEQISTWVVEFPMKAPEGALTRKDLAAIDQLEWYKQIQTHWCEHNQSVTIYVKDDEWISVGDWVYKNWDIASGVSFLPYDGGHYKLAPYEEISKDQYQTMLKNQIKIDYSRLHEFEAEDTTEGAKTLACLSGVCEI